MAKRYSRYSGRIRRKDGTKPPPRISANYALRPEVWNAITENAAKFGLSRSELIERAVDFFLTNLEVDEAKTVELKSSKIVENIAKILRKYNI